MGFSAWIHVAQCPDMVAGEKRRGLALRLGLELELRLGLELGLELGLYRLGLGLGVELE